MPRKAPSPLVLSLVAASLLVVSGASEAATVRSVEIKMGSRFEITVVHPERARGERAIAAAWAEIDRLEAMISSWRRDSETSLINRNAGVRPVAVSPELFNLIRRSLKVSDLTGGAFDITFAGAGRLWDFKAEKPRLPDPEAIRKAIARVDYRRVILDEKARTVFLERPGMRIGFGAIGKGFAANRAVRVLKEAGIGNGMVNAGGDLLGFGIREDGRSWGIGIAHPRQRERIFAWLRLNDQAVVTSGDYESFIVVDGKRYGHILDPRTGWPVDSLMSATLLCPDAELADALATATSVLGPEKGMALINKLKGVEALLVDRDGKVHYSAHLKTHLSDQPEEDPS